MNLKRIGILLAACLGAVLFVHTIQIAVSAPTDDTLVFLPIATGGDGSGSSPIDTNVSTDQFPLGLAVASPFEATEVAPSLSGLQGTTTGTWTTAYDSAIDQINGVLSGSVVISDVFDPGSFLQTSGRAECYGPQLEYTNHIDSPGANGQMPTGDLGIWNEYDVTGDACAAAQLNQRLNSTYQQSQAGLVLLAGMLQVAATNSMTLPTSGGILTMTAEMNAAGFISGSIDNAYIAYNVLSDTWSYETSISAFDPVMSFTRSITVHMDHTAGATDYDYSGTMYWLVNDRRNAFNCGGGLTDVTVNGSLEYDRDTETDMRIQARAGLFCGLDENGIQNGVVDPTGNWKDDFSIFSAEYDPTTIAGQYAYAWQAGSMDSYSRVLNVGINSHDPVDGESYFGYGNRVQDDADGVIGIDGFFCSWVGPTPTNLPPGHADRFVEYAQRQWLRFDTGTGLFESRGVDIHYAPTLDCLYNGSTTFWYDRDLDRNTNESAADLTVTPSDLDLMEPYDLDGDFNATIPEAIENRGYSLPAAP